MFRTVDWSNALLSSWFGITLQKGQKHESLPIGRRLGGHRSAIVSRGYASACENSMPINSVGYGCHCSVETSGIQLRSVP